MIKILLVAYDNDSHIHCFPLGLAYVAAALEKAGHFVQVYNQDVHHYENEHLTKFLDENNFDFIAVGVVGGYYQYRKLIEISEAINNSKNRPFYFIGGHGPSPEPEYFIKKTNADVVVIGEADETVVELVDVVSNKRDLSTVNGIAFKDENGVFKTTPRRKLIKDVDSIPFPAYHLFPIEYYRLIREPHALNSDFVMAMVSGRGCTFKCNFCYRMDKGFRPRSNEAIIEEIKLLKKDYGINYVAFNDELLMSSEKRVVSLCEDFIKENLNIKWKCSGRLNYATPEVIKIMKKSGCVFINYGIESFDNEELKRMNKVLTTDQIVKGIEATLNENISPGFNIIFGNIDETEEILNKGVEFLLKYDDCSQLRTIRPVTPYPGSPLYYYAIEKGLLKDCEDFYENKHTNSDLLSVNFTKMTDDDFHLALYKANKKLIENHNKKQNERTDETMLNVYVKKDASFRGFRPV